MNPNTPHSKPNRLAQESSPYLLQHAHNPVDWHPWGDEALKKAARAQKPIFLSIGYSACHWCHVMEKESFEDPSVADLLNAHFVSIKVDREERPDLDHIYMSAVQVLTQHGGWPMSVFLTPDMEPFYGGTYFPPEDRHGLPAFKKVLTNIAQAWKEQKDQIKLSARELTQAMKSLSSLSGEKGALELSLLDTGMKTVIDHLDPVHGGLGHAPKFFHTSALQLGMHQAFAENKKPELEKIAHTLEKIAHGGIYDHLGGGFHRYSVDNEWHVPHFEKMLYDNALLSETYLHAFQYTSKIQFAQVALETLDYLLTEMRSPEGAFFATQDADSEGVEGKFYIWDQESVLKNLAEDIGNLFCDAYDVPVQGNWEHGQSILRRVKSNSELALKYKMEETDVAEALLLGRRKLYKVRQSRIAPQTDKKIILSWNAMVLRSLTLAYEVLGERKYYDAATKCASFLEMALKSPALSQEGTPLMYRVYHAGKSRFTAHLDDYAQWIDALLCLYSCDFNPKWLELAQTSATTLLSEFWDKDQKLFYFTGATYEKLCIRPTENHDGATPSGMSVAAGAILRLYYYTQEEKWLRPVKELLERHAQLLKDHPLSNMRLLGVFSEYRNTPPQIAIVQGLDLEEWDQVVDLVRRNWKGPKLIASPRPKSNTVKTFATAKDAIDGKATVYLCQNFQCKTPWVGIDAIEEEILKKFPNTLDE